MENARCHRWVIEVDVRGGEMMTRARARERERLIFRLRAGRALIRARVVRTRASGERRLIDESSFFL